MIIPSTKFVIDGCYKINENSQLREQSYLFESSQL